MRLSHVEIEVVEVPECTPASVARAWFIRSVLSV